MYCKECGVELDNDSKFCSDCGTKQSVRRTHSQEKEISKRQNPVTEILNVPLSTGTSTELENQPKPASVEKYDKSYEGDQHAAVFGIIVMSINLGILFTTKIYDTDSPTNTGLVALVNSIYRVIVTIWVVNIAKNQNRNRGGWGILAFILPNLALIIIGFSRKLLRSKSEVTKTENQGYLFQEESSDGYEFSKVTFKIKAIKKIETFWTGSRDVKTIEFSDGKEGDVFAYGSDEFFIVTNPGAVHIYYNSQDASIAALHYYLSTNKISKRGRTI